MKTLITFVTILVSTVCSSQVIDSITISPQQPTTEDTIQIYVHSTFNYGACSGTSDYSIINNEINSSSIHCVGILAYICEDIDTFKINPLPAGTYHFYHTLSSGLGPIPCSPGIVADDNDTLTFTVEQKLGMKPIENNILKVYPNPVTQKCLISFDEKNTHFQMINVLDVCSRQVFSKEIHEQNQIELDLSSLKSGIYFFELIEKEGASTELVKIIKE